MAFLSSEPRAALNKPACNDVYVKSQLPHNAKCSSLLISTTRSIMLSEVGQSISLDPKPGFVVKTRILEGHSIGTKVFINVCHDLQVPRPDKDFDPQVVFPLIIENKWEIPHILSRQRETTDKKGVVSLLFDCCMNSVCFQWCQINQDLRSIAIEWCIESVELMYSLVLDREISIPKMLCKGELCQTVIPKSELSVSGFQKTLQELKDNEVLGLVEELGDPVEEDQGLPNIMDIESKRGKPMIQELDDMKLEDLERKVEHMKEEKAKETPLIQEISRSDVKRTTSSMSDKLPKSLIFELSFHKAAQFLVKIKFPQLLSSNSLKLSYLSSTHSLLIQNVDPEYCFGKSDRLEVPLPSSVTIQQDCEVACEFVKSEHTLYVVL